MRNGNHFGNDWHLKSKVNSKMTNVKQVTRQWKPFFLSKTLKIDIIYMNQFEENSDLELLLSFKNLRSYVQRQKINETWNPSGVETTFFSIKRRSRIHLKWTTILDHWLYYYEFDNFCRKFDDIYHHINKILSFNLMYKMFMYQYM